MNKLCEPYDYTIFPEHQSHNSGFFHYGVAPRKSNWPDVYFQRLALHDVSQITFTMRVARIFSVRGRCYILHLFRCGYKRPSPVVRTMLSISFSLLYVDDDVIPLVLC